MNAHAKAKADEALRRVFSDSVIRSLDESARRAADTLIKARRDRLAKAIASCIAHPDLFWTHRYFWRLPMIGVFSTDEAVSETRKALSKAKLRKGHWSYDAGFLCDLGEALIFARYFRRFGQRVWARRAA